MPIPGDNLEKNPDGTPKDNSHNYTPDYVEDLKQKSANIASENTILEEVIKVQNSDDNEYLLELHKENPAMAGRVAKKMGYDLDEAISLVQEAVNAKNPPAGNGQLNEDEIVNKTISRIKGEDIKKIENKFFEELPDNTRDDVKRYYKKISKAGVDSVNDAQELLEMAKIYVNKDNKTPEQKEVISKSSLSLGVNNGFIQKPSKEIPAETQKLAKDLGIEL